MISYLVVIAIVAAIVGGQTGKHSGKGWAYVTAISFATLAASLVMCSVLLFLRPEYAPLPDDLGKYRGRGASIVIGLWVFFHSMGPKGTGLILGGIGLFSIRAVRAQLADIRRGVYTGMDELERRQKLQAQYLGLVAKAKALSEANQADAKWIEAQKAKTFPSREEAERAATAINAMIERRLARVQEIQALLDRVRTLEPDLNSAHSEAKNRPSAAA
jgi:hypothetical protein